MKNRFDFGDVLATHLRSENSPELQNSEIVEVPILLHGWQFSALEKEAHVRGLTAAEMVRHLLDDFLHRSRNSSEESSRVSAF
jgi:hypothetical protein